MLYRILKWLFYPTVRGYFRSLHVEGRSNIPDSGPIIFVANHNSAFMDPILLGVHIKQPIYFLARGEAFKSKLVSGIFYLLNMIPVYRPEVTPDKIYKNKEVFKRCYTHLYKGKTLLIFPEGFSETVRHLRPLKTGTARIALGAEDEYDFQLNVKVVPIGINYSDPHTFQSDVVINFGPAMEMDRYRDAYLKGEKDGVINLTDDINHRLEELLLIVDEEENYELFSQIEILCRNELEATTNGDGLEQENFKLLKGLAKSIEIQSKDDPDKMIDLKLKLDTYFRKLDRYKINDEQIKNGKRRLHLLPNVLYFLFGFPVFLYGVLVNFLPYTAVRILSATIKVREDFVGSLKLALGAFAFLIFYIMEIVIFASLFKWYWTLLFIFSLYPSGLFALRYVKRYLSFRNNYSYHRLVKRKKKVIYELKVIRGELVRSLEKVLNPTYSK